MRIANEISSLINTISSSFSNNITQSQLTNTIQDFESVLDESVSVRIAQEAINNSTIQALRLATLINDIDINYANSFSVQPFNMSAMGMDQHGQQSNESKDIQNLTAYQTAQELLIPVKEVFEEIGSEQENTNPDKVSQLKENIDNLTTIMEIKKPYNEVAKVIHGIIQPTLQELYNLKIDMDSK